MNTKPTKTEPELLKLLNSRKAWALPPYREPMYDPAKVAAAVHAHSLANNTDPFAAARMRLHLLRGYELPSDILSESNKILNDRRNRKRHGNR